MSMRGITIAWFATRNRERPEVLAQEIRAELESHLQMIEDELVSTGVAADEARREALRRFGDVDRVAEDCQRIRMRERVLMQKVSSILLILMAGALTWFVLQARAARVARDKAVAALESALERERSLRSRRSEMESRPAPGVPGERTEQARSTRRHAAADAEQEPDIEDILTRLNATWSLQKADALFENLIERDADEAIELIRAGYARIESAEARLRLLEHFLTRHPRRAFDVLGFGLEDADASVREKTELRLASYAMLEPGSEDLRRWWEANRDKRAQTAFADALRAWVGDLSKVPFDRLASRLERLGREESDLARSLGLDLGDRLRQFGAHAALERAMLSGDPEAVANAWKLAATVSVDEAFARRHALPMLSDPSRLSSKTRRGMYEVLASQRAAWATNALVGAMRATPARTAGSFYGVARALAESGDPRAIPDMIGMIVADGDYRTVYGIGYFGLGRLTGVEYDESHDGKWWLDWWRRNRSRFPAAVRQRAIPTIRLRK